MTGQAGVRKFSTNRAERCTETFEQALLNEARACRRRQNPACVRMLTFARGKKIPPARAATEGMAGDRRASAKTREYVRPREVLPKAATMV